MVGKLRGIIPWGPKHLWREPPPSPCPEESIEKEGSEQSGEELVAH